MESFRGFTVAPGTGPLDAATTWLRRAQARGAAFAPRYLRRLLGLALIGIAHALLLYVGDILVTYALLGAVLLLLRNAPIAWLVRLAVGLVALTAVLCLLGGVAVALLADELGAELATEDVLGDEAAVAANRGTPGDAIAQRAREYPAR